MLGKPTASLSSGLLARKGHARPAMRPQGFVSLSPSSQDDLGWNDMGEDFAPAHQTRIQIQPVAHEATVEAPAPTVLRQRAELAEQIAPKAEERLAPAPAFTPEATPIVSAGTLARVAREATSKSKAAFTLRLDHDRHLRLRLASAVTNHSAQQLVTQALDAFLESLTQVDALARQIDAKRNG